MNISLGDKKRIVYGLERASIFVEFDVLSRHIEFSNRAIKSEISEIKKEIDKEIKTLDEYDHEDYLDYISDEYEHAASIIPNIQWRSDFISIYSYFEYALNKICSITQKRSNLNLSFKDLSGQGITRARNYLVKVAGIEAPFQSNKWQRAKLLAEVRNALVHRNAEVEYTLNDKKSLSAKLAKEKHINLYQVIPDQKDAEIILNYEFVKNSFIELKGIVLDICNYELYPDNS